MGVLTYVLLLVPFGVISYPIYGTKRYGRTPMSWGSPMQVPNYYYVPRRYPMSYYEAMNPYLQEYSDEYYLPQEYPVYYPALKSPKYDYYQAMPYYFEDSRQLGRDGYGYMDQLDPEELQEQLQQEEDRLEREESLPVGQETWYQNDDSNREDSIDDINAAFLQNLMLYNDAMSTQKDFYPQKDPYNEEILTYTEEPSLSFKNQEDLDVKELKQLAGTGKPKKQRKNKNKNKSKNKPKELPNSSDSWLDYPPKRNSFPNSLQPLPNQPQLSTYFPEIPSSFSPRKTFSSSTPPPQLASNKIPESKSTGQKEFVLIRPATPVRKPFTKPVMEMLSKNVNNGNQKVMERKRDPNVYETIKHLLEMEKNLEKGYPGQDGLKPPMKKRYVSTEENLVDQLSTLKKTA